MTCGKGVGGTDDGVNQVGSHIWQLTFNSENIKDTQHLGKEQSSLTRAFNAKMTKIRLEGWLSG